MENKLILLLSLFFFFSFCSVKQTELSLIESNYSIDLDGEKEVSLPLSTYFKNAKSIIFETEKECQIGMINEFQVFDGCIYVLDLFYAKSLYVFDIDGKFIRKIGNMGNGPGEYIQPIDFTIDAENRFIFLLDYGQRVHKYHLDGTFVQTVTPKVQDANIMFIQYYKDKLYLSVRAYNPTMNSYMLLESDPNNGTILSESLPLKYNKGWARQITTGHSFFKSRLNSPPLYTQLYMDYIVALGEEITPHIKIVGKNLVREKDIEKFPNEVTENESYDNALRNFSKIWDVQNFVENDNLIMFRYQYAYMTFCTMIFNKKTREVKLTNYLSNDLIFRKDESGSFGWFKFSDTKGAYEILHGKKIKDLQESMRNNETVPELDKKDELLQLDEESNPVIFYYEFK